MGANVWLLPNFLSSEPLQQPYRNILMLFIFSHCMIPINIHKKIAIKMWKYKKSINTHSRRHYFSFFWFEFKQRMLPLCSQFFSFVFCQTGFSCLIFIFVSPSKVELNFRLNIHKKLLFAVKREGPTGWLFCRKKKLIEFVKQSIEVSHCWTVWADEIC